MTPPKLHAKLCACVSFTSAEDPSYLDSSRATCPRNGLEGLEAPTDSLGYCDCHIYFCHLFAF